MKAMKFVAVFLCFSLFAIGCGNKNPLTRKNIRKLLSNPPRNQERLIPETLYGCLRRPSDRRSRRDRDRRSALNRIPGGFSGQGGVGGFDSGGDSCSVTVVRDDTIEVDFLGNVYPITVVGLGNNEEYDDILVGEVGSNELIVVEHRRGRVESVTHTEYDRDDEVIYGRSGQGEYIQECDLDIRDDDRSSVGFVGGMRRDCRR